MARKKDSPQKAALRELMENYLKENNVKVGCIAVYAGKIRLIDNIVF